ncbi:MAG: hypothetical protein WCH39_08325 [Schlesneria sp.]
MNLVWLCPGRMVLRIHSDAASIGTVTVFGDAVELILAWCHWRASSLASALAFK